MRTTSIKDVSAVMSAFASGLEKNATAASNTSFQSVWDNQTGMEEASKNKATETKPANHQDEALKAKETVRKEPKEVEKPDTTKTEDTEKSMEKAMEVLGTTANEMMQKVADTLGMSIEELAQLMEDMGMSTMDILNPEQLSMLILEANGVQNSMALLTDEALYADYTGLMETQQELLTQVADELQLSQEQLTALFAEADDAQVVVNEPVIEVSVEGDELSNGQLQRTDEKAETGNEQQASENSDNQTGNLLLQNLKANVTQAVVQTTQTASVWDADTQNIMRQIMDYMKIQVKPEVSDMELQLHPAHLGSLRIHVSAQGGMVTANFLTENETVKSALESQMIQLKESFAEQGVKVDAIEVTVQTHQFERNLDRGQGRESGESGKKSRTRRINLNALNSMEENQEMTQEDELVAEMMTANGSTVDYTV